ncbi:MAG: hypothetical protein CMP48_17060 [Rickettsiales bacterium]|nr:hypothetical protein [Rickettsiales bacterium]
MIKALLFLTITLISFASSAQFAEKLDKEIAELKSRMKLDGISKEDYFTSLADMSGDMPLESVNAIMTGPWWRYSHTVYPDGREVRLSSARGVLKFPDETNAYYIKRNEKDTAWCEWSYAEGQLLLHRFKDKSKQGNPLAEPLNLHSLTEKRLVLIALVKSKEYPDKYRAVFHVYFRR